MKEPLDFQVLLLLPELKDLANGLLVPHMEFQVRQAAVGKDVDCANAQGTCDLDGDGRVEVEG